ncbi:MAG: hypothetical protein KGI08_06215, partial [Thaumarchaeota archaeon]|nr:hypothetical protein [Nitrososphaerota archaeon]
MFVPFININSIANEDLVQYIKTIYSKIYHYEKNDLLQNMSKSLPKVIKLTDKDKIGDMS